MPTITVRAKLSAIVICELNMIKLYIIIPGKNGRQSCPAIDKDNI
jgi:hypothetical protein